MNAPTLQTAIDLAVAGGDTVRLTLSNPPEAVSLLILHKTIRADNWTQAAKALATTIDIDGLAEGVVHEFCAVAIDGAGAYSLPSRPLRAIPTKGEGPISRRIEKDVISALETITEAQGHFDDVDKVYRFSFPVDVTNESGLFLVVNFAHVDHELSDFGSGGVIDQHEMDVFVGGGRNGRDGSEDWTPDSIHEMLASVQIALEEDPERSGLAIDTIPTDDILDPQTLGQLRSMADAMAAKKFRITYMTPRSDPYANAA